MIMLARPDAPCYAGARSPAFVASFYEAPRSARTG
jgi:hypothetical protein